MPQFQPYHARTLSEKFARTYVLISIPIVINILLVLRIVPLDLDRSFSSGDGGNLLLFWRHHIEIIARARSPLPLPSPDYPFAFFHIRKSGGSSLRSALNNSLGNLSRWIPCFSPKPCCPYSLPPFERKAVYASHLNYMQLTSTLQEASINTSNSGDLTQVSLANNTRIHIHQLAATQRFSCVTMLRSTVSRVVSCWNYRFVRDTFFSLPPADMLTPQDWDNLLPKTFDRYSNGCNNENFRIFGSSSADEIEVNTLTPNHPSFQSEFNSSAKRLLSCVILLSERCNESTKVLSHYIPWLSNVDLCDIRLNKDPMGRGINNLTKGANEVIKVNNIMDELLFELGTVMFEAQLKAMEH